MSFPPTNVKKVIFKVFCPIRESFVINYLINALKKLLTKGLKVIN